MGNTCQITGAGPRSAQNVSHSNRKTKRVVKPNLQTKKVLNPATGLMMKITASAKGFKTLKKWADEGKKYDLRDIIKKK